MNSHFAAQLTQELFAIANDRIVERILGCSDGEWVALDGDFHWCDSTGTVRVILYRGPGKMTDFEIDDVWFN